MISDSAVPPLDRREFRYSIVIPVFNSEQIVGTTIDRVVATFTEHGLDHEIILVNDGSTDGSWELIAEKARTIPQVIALDLLRNYGQHHANLAGLREATGDFVITMDDDLQNPPDQALLLIDEAMTGRDLVFGNFERKQAAGYRRLGSSLISMMNRRIFGRTAGPGGLQLPDPAPRRGRPDLRLVDGTPVHHRPGAALLTQAQPRGGANEPRPVGKSNYSLVRILRLVLTILFSYSSYPLRLAAVIGFGISGLSFLLGTFYLLYGALGRTEVQGWTTTVVLLSMFNGFIIALLSMLGEYVVRTLNAVSAQHSYHVSARVPE